MWITSSTTNITMSGPVSITDNAAQFGGAIWTRAERLTLAADADISSNTAIVAVRFYVVPCHDTLWPLSAHDALSNEGNSELVPGAKTLAPFRLRTINVTIAVDACVCAAEYMCL